MKQKKQFRNKAIVFKRWSGKRYAILQSLNKCLKIGVLSASYTLASTPAKAEDQQDTILPRKYENIEEIVITDEAIGTLSPMDAQVTEVISAHEIKTLAAQSPEDLMQHALNVDVRSRGTHGIQADIALQGGTFDQTLILLNGMNLSDPHTGHFSMNIPIDMDNIHQIEIMKPGRTKLFGHGGFSGAINFITSPVYQNFSTLSVRQGSHNTIQLQGQTNRVTGGIAQSVSAGISRSDGHTENTDFSKQNLMYQGKWVGNKMDLNWHLGYLAKEFGANSFYTPLFPAQYETNQTLVSGIAASYGKKIQFLPAIYWRRNNDHFMLFRDEPERYQNFHQSNVYGTNLKFHIPISLKIKATGGVLYRNEGIRSNNLGHETPDIREIPAQDSLYHKSYQRSNLNTYGQIQFRIRKFSLTPLLALNYNTATNRFDFLPSLSVEYIPKPHITLYTNIDRSMRNPTFTDLFYKGPNNLGNASLQPEFARQTDIGIKYKRHAHFVQTSFFYRHGSQIIDWMKKSVEDKWQTNNITNLNTLGFHVQYSANLSQSTLPLLNTLNVSYGYTKQEKTNVSYISHYALDNLKHKASVRIHLRIFASLTGSVAIGYQERNGGFELYDTNKQRWEFHPYQPVATADLKVVYKRKWLRLYGQITNLFDQGYYDISNVIQPGRWIDAGMALSWSHKQ